MGGSVKKSVSKAFSNPIRSTMSIGTFGTSELARKVPQIDQTLGMPERLFGYGMGGMGGGMGQFGSQDPAAFLAQTGGAPLLANIAMGASVDDTLAGYLGIDKSQLDDRNTSLSPQQRKDINAVRTQLQQIQSNRQLRQQAVDKVVQDFPNIVQTNMKIYGDQFDADMKQYVDMALQGTAAKYAAGGNLSSGASAAAFARTGAEQALNKMNYSNQNAVRDANIRLAEVNAMRDFQNTMLGQTSNQGFSAQQAALQRQFQGQMQQMDFANQQKLSDQASKNALFGAVGSLGGTILGGMIGGPAGAGVGGSMGGSLLGGNMLNSGSAGQSFGNPFGTFSGSPRLNLPRY